MRYTEEFIKFAISKAVKGRNAASAAREIGIPEETLRGWLKKRQIKLKKPRVSKLRSYPQEVKIRVVYEIINLNITISSAANRYSIPKSTIDRWLSLYRTSGRVSKESYKYTSEFKEYVLNKVRNGVSVKQISLLYGIDRSSIQSWRKSFNNSTSTSPVDYSLFSNVIELRKK